MKVLTDTRLLFWRKMKETLRNPIYMLSSLLTPIIYLVLFAPLLKKLVGLPGLHDERRPERLRAGTAGDHCVLRRALRGLRDDRRGPKWRRRAHARDADQPICAAHRAGFFATS